MPNRLQWLMARLWQWVVNESGQDLVEYGLVVFLCSLIAISLQQQLAVALVRMFTNVSATLA